MFDYAVKSYELVYNIKWTMLKHIQYMINREDVFHDIIPGGLPDERFVDSASELFVELPSFGVEFIGVRFEDGEYKRIFYVRYQGKNISFKPQHKFGITGEDRRLLHIQDIIFANFYELSRDNKLEIYNFTNGDIAPSKSGRTMSMTLLDMTTSRSEPTASRINGLEFEYSVLVNM